jgi:hypothetical protein
MLTDGFGTASRTDNETFNVQVFTSHLLFTVRTYERLPFCYLLLTPFGWLSQLISLALSHFTFLSPTIADRRRLPPLVTVC